MSLTSFHPGNLVEAAPVPPPLAGAITEQEHLAAEAESQQQVGWESLQAGTLSA